MQDDPNSISRRAALQRIGLGALSAYAAPAFSTLSMAHAASGGSGGSGGEGGSGASGGASGGSASGGASGGSGTSGASGGEASGAASTAEPATISIEDHERARRAVQQGRALPLSTVLDEVFKSVPGRLISVSYRETTSRNIYILKMISNKGKLVSVRVNAQTAAIIR